MLINWYLPTRPLWAPAQPHLPFRHNWFLIPASSHARFALLEPSLTLPFPGPFHNSFVTVELRRSILALRAILDANSHDIWFSQADTWSLRQIQSFTKPQFWQHITLVNHRVWFGKLSSGIRNTYVSWVVLHTNDVQAASQKHRAHSGQTNSQIRKGENRPYSYSFSWAREAS